MMDKKKLEALRTTLYPVFEQYELQRVVLFGTEAPGNAASGMNLLVDNGFDENRIPELSDEIERRWGSELGLYHAAYMEPGSQVDQEIALTGMILYPCA